LSIGKAKKVKKLPKNRFMRFIFREIAEKSDDVVFDLPKNRMTLFSREIARKTISCVSGMGQAFADVLRLKKTTSFPWK
jgi:hypothetical protein